MFRRQREKKIVIAVFPSRNALIHAIDDLIQRGSVDINHAAIVAKAANGETVVVGDKIRPDEGGLAGGTFGATLGILGLVNLGVLALPGIGLVLTAISLGAAAGGLVGMATGRLAAAKLTDPGIPEPVMGILSDLLAQGDAALILSVDNIEDAEALQRAVKVMNTTLATRVIDGEKLAVARVG